MLFMGSDARETVSWTLLPRDLINADVPFIGRRKDARHAEQLPQGVASQPLLAALERLLLAFEISLVLSADGRRLLEVHFDLRPSTESVFGRASPHMADADTALSWLLVVYNRQLMIPNSATVRRMSIDENELAELADWVHGAEVTVPLLQFSSGVALGGNMHISLKHGCVLDGPPVPDTFRVPDGLVAVGAPAQTHPQAREWLSRPFVEHDTDRTEQPLLGAMHSALVVVPDVRIEEWRRLLEPRACVRTGAALAAMTAADLCLAGVVLLSSGALVSVEYEAAWRRACVSRVAGVHDSEAQMSMRTRCMAYARRIRAARTALTMLPAMPHLVHWGRVVIDDVPAFGQDAGMRSAFEISGVTRLALSEDGRFFDDHAFSEFSGLDPAVCRHAYTGAVYRMPETYQAPPEFTPAFFKDRLVWSDPSKNAPPDVRLAAVLSNDRFAQQLTTRVVAQRFSQFAADVAATMRTVAEDCPICMASAALGIFSCGHRICLQCAHRLPTESVCVAVQTRRDASHSRMTFENRVARRCPVCRELALHVYAPTLPIDRRCAAVMRCIRAFARAGERDIWVLAHWAACLLEVEALLCREHDDYWTTFEATSAGDDARGAVVVRLLCIDQSGVIPAYPLTRHVAVVWMHTPCFRAPHIDWLNADRVFNAAGRRKSRAKIVVSAEGCDSELLHERFEHTTVRVMAPRGMP